MFILSVGVTIFLYGMLLVWFVRCMKADYWFDLDIGTGLVVLCIVLTWGLWEIHVLNAENLEYISIIERLTAPVH